MNIRLLRKMGGAKVKFLLRDDFNDTLAAGSVNGTLAAPGGMGTVAQNTRTVADTNSKWSVGSGVLDVATGSAAVSNIHWGSHARLAGRVMIFRVTPANTTGQYFEVGMDANVTGGLADFIYFYNGGDGYLLPVGISGPLMFKYTATTYDFAPVMSGSGYYWFIKGGAFTNWTLLYKTTQGNGVAFPGLCMEGASIFTCSFARVPLALWLPTILCYDTFTRSNGAIGTSETSGLDSQNTTARTWTGGTWTIATNVAVNTPTLGSELATGNLVVGTWYSITATQANYFYTGSAIGDTFRAAATTALDANNKVQAITLATLFASQTDAATASILANVDLVATTRMQTGMVVNLDSATSPDDFIIAYIDQNVGAGTTRILLDECVNGVYTNKITVTNATHAASARLVVIRNGTECRVFYKDIAVGTVQTMTANTNTLHGLFSTNVANTFNNLLIMPRGTGGEYKDLDRFTKGG